MAEPNYDEYNLADLKDAAENIDKSKYPERYNKIISEINLRLDGKKQKTETIVIQYSNNLTFFEKINNLLIPQFNTIEDANRVIRNSSYYLLFLIIIELFYTIFSVVSKINNENKAIYIASLIMSLVILITELLLVFGIYKKKSFCAIILAIILFIFLYYSFNIFYFFALYFTSISNYAIMKLSKLQYKTI